MGKNYNYIDISIWKDSPDFLILFALKSPLENIKEFRLMTKKTGESKGCGFLEFDNKASYWVSRSYCTVERSWYQVLSSVNLYSLILSYNINLVVIIIDNHPVETKVCLQILDNHSGCKIIENEDTAAFRISCVLFLMIFRLSN